MELCILLLLFITGTLAQQDMSDKVFIFPSPSTSSCVILKPIIKKSLQKVSVCLQFYTVLSRDYSLFSLAISGSDNAFLIYSQPPNVCIVNINQEENIFMVDPDTEIAWKHTCATWDSTTGIVQLWINGKLYPRKVSKKGFTIDSAMSIVLAQDQDSFGGGFDINQSFAGEISDVNMWDYTLTAEDMQNVMYGKLHGNIINWKSLTYEIKGNVFVQPKL
ncbi:C-reactive protein-like isoform 2-T3 [Mantella aurantiaca]